MEMTRNELIDEIRSKTHPRIYQDVTLSTTAMLRAWLAYLLSDEKEKGADHWDSNGEMPSDYIGLFFSLKCRKRVHQHKVPTVAGIAPNGWPIIEVLTITHGTD